MTINVADFNKPDKHPYGMLGAFDNASEKENVLAFILTQCIEAGKWIPFKMKYRHDSMVTDGLLEKIEDKTYELTTKAKGLLYSFYGK